MEIERSRLDQKVSSNMACQSMLDIPLSYNIECSDPKWWHSGALLYHGPTPRFG